MERAGIDGDANRGLRFDDRAGFLPLKLTFMPTDRNILQIIQTILEIEVCCFVLDVQLHPIITPPVDASSRALAQQPRDSC